MIKFSCAAACLALVAACAVTPTPYGPASTSEALGFSELKIESNRYRVTYRGDDAVQARDYALLRASELTLESGADWFRVVNAYSDEEGGRSGGGSSVSIGGSAGSGGYSSVGLGVGIGFPIGGGGGSRETVHVMEILTGSGEKPDGVDVYDAASVRDSLLGAPAG